MKFKKNRNQPFRKQQKQFHSGRNIAGAPLNGNKAHNIRRHHHTSVPFVALSDDAEQKNFSISPNNLSCFHGFSSIFTLQHRADFTVDNVLYKSVDQYYQIRKIKDLLGIESEKFTDGSANNFSSLARELLKQSSIDRRTIDQWRITCGVNVIQKALLEKVCQLETMRNALVETVDKLIVHTYAADDFFGTGVPFKYVKDWCQGMEDKKAIAKFPMSYPLTSETLKSVPRIAKGRNVLGAIYMILREKINTGKLDTLTVELIKFEGVLKPSSNSQSTKPAGLRSEFMDIDFTADYDPIVPTTAEPVMAIDTSLTSAPTEKIQIKVKRTTTTTKANASNKAVVATIPGIKTLS